MIHEAGHMGVFMPVRKSDHAHPYTVVGSHNTSVAGSGKSGVCHEHT